MYRFILIRSYRQEDELFCKELLKAGITDSLNATFTAFLTGKRAMNVINASVVIFTFALIVIGFPFVYCIMVLFIPPIVLYIFLYATFLYEARDVGNKTFAIPWYYILIYFFCFLFLLAFFVSFYYFLFS